ncbi:hypothetical protein AKJ16_DCAP25371 [Drosera capensis]
MKRHPICFHSCPHKQLLHPFYDASAKGRQLTSCLKREENSAYSSGAHSSGGAFGAHSGGGAFGADQSCKWRERRTRRVDCALGEWLKHMKDGADLMSLLMKFPAVGS